MNSNSIYASPFDEFRQSCFRLESSPLTFFEVTGADALSWLQGQLTNDVRKLDSNSPLDACVCSPTGQIVAMLRLWSSDGRLIIGAHNLGVSAVLERFERMVILEDVAIRALPFETTILQGARSAEHLGQGAEFNVPLDLTGATGFALLLAEPSISLDSLPSVDDETLRMMEIEAGRPRFGFDTDAKTFPAELGDPFLDRCVNFEKGCYTGQEVVMRIHSRGRVNRQWVALIGDEPIESGAQTFDGDEPIGKVLWSSSKSRGFCSAMVKSLAVPSASSRACSVAALFPIQ